MTRTRNKCVKKELGRTMLPRLVDYFPAPRHKFLCNLPSYHAEVYSLQAIDCSLSVSFDIRFSFRVTLFLCSQRVGLVPRVFRTIGPPRTRPINCSLLVHPDRF